MAGGRVVIQLWVFRESLEALSYCTQTILWKFCEQSLREPVKNYLPTISAKGFWAGWFSVKGGGGYPPIPLRKKSAKKRLFLAKKR